jgi:glycosyltransferase involved in cell wall biosynthesis
LKILVINWRDLRHPRAGGAEVRLHQVYEPMAAAGHRVDLFTCAFEGGAVEEEVNGLHVHRLGADWNFNLLVMLRLRSWIRELQPDVVVEDFNKLPFLTPWLSPVPVLVQMHHLWMGSIFREASLPVALLVWGWEQSLRLVYRGSHFCVVSPSTRDELCSMGPRPENVAIIYNGVDMEFYTPGANSGAGSIAESGANSAQPPFLLWLGRLQKYKGILEALEAFALLAPTHPALQLKVEGSGPFLAQAQARANALGISDRVEFLGFVSEERKRELLRRAVLLLQTSWKEGWGLTVIEANACGTPVVAARAPGLRDSVSDGETGLLCNPGDGADMARAVNSLLDDPARMAQLRHAAVTWAHKFSWREASDQTLQLLQEIAR